MGKEENDEDRRDRHEGGRRQLRPEHRVHAATERRVERGCTSQEVLQADRERVLAVALEHHVAQEEIGPVEPTVASATYSFVDPASMPATRVRCANRNTTSTGAMAMIVAIASSGL